MTDPTKEDHDATRRYFEEMCIPYPHEFEIDAFLAGRASMRAEIMEATGGEGATSPTTAELVAHIRAMEAREVEGQLAQARALLREVKEAGTCWGGVHPDAPPQEPCGRCLRCRVAAHLKSEGGESESGGTLEVSRVSPGLASALSLSVASDEIRADIPAHLESEGNDG